MYISKCWDAGKVLHSYLHPNDQLVAKLSNQLVIFKSSELRGSSCHLYLGIHIIYINVNSNKSAVNHFQHLSGSLTTATFTLGELVIPIVRKYIPTLV